MTDLTLELIAQTMINIAGRECRDRECGGEGRIPGTRWRHLRCADCPLDDVDSLADALMDSVGKLEALR